MIAEMFPREKRGKMMGVFQAMLPLGIALGLTAGGFIASTWGWRHAFGVVAIPGLIVSILFFFVKDYKTYALVETKKADDQLTKVEKMSRKEIVKEIFRSKSLIWLAIGWTLASFATVAVTAWGPSVLQRYWNISVQFSNTLVSAHVMASALFYLLGGFLADWLFKKNVKSRFAIPAIALLVYAVFFLVVFLTVGSTVAIVLIIGSAVTMVWMPVILAAIQDVAHPGLRTSTGVVIAFLQLVLGNGLAPVIFGMISDKFDLSSMFVVITISSVLSAIVFFVGMFFFKADLKRAKELDQQLGVAA
jgi:sugar phosphate permease